VTGSYRRHGEQVQRVISRELQITALFAFLGAVLWLVSGRFTDAAWVRWAILIGVGVIIPTIITERMES